MRDGFGVFVGLFLVSCLVLARAAGCFVKSLLTDDVVLAIFIVLDLNQTIDQILPFPVAVP